MRRFILRSIAGAGSLLFASTAFLAYLQYSGNFHTVSAGEVYRSAQMNSEDLELWTKEHHIASVLNLRGENAHKEWYEQEIAMAQALGLAHIDFRMSASEELTPEEVHALIAIMRDAPKPMLIHCQGGSDRTGLASALYVAAIEGGSELAAEWQLSLRYGHIGLPFSKAWAMNETWEKMEGWLGFPNS